MRDNYTPNNSTIKLVFEFENNEIINAFRDHNDQHIPTTRNKIVITEKKREIKLKNYSHRK